MSFPLRTWKGPPFCSLCLCPAVVLACAFCLCLVTVVVPCSRFGPACDAVLAASGLHHRSKASQWRCLFDDMFSRSFLEAILLAIEWPHWMKNTWFFQCNMGLFSNKENKSAAVKQPHHQGELCQETKKRGWEGVFRVAGPYPYFDVFSLLVLFTTGWC